MTFGERLVALRKQRGWKQRHLAQAAQVDHSWLSRIERDQRKGLSLDTAIRLAQALGVSLDTLVGGNENENGLSA